MSSVLRLLCLLASGVSALTQGEWAKQSIYQVVVDRFARTDGSTSAACDLNSYCGGSWRGIINHLDYIQGMGFTAIWISPIVTQIEAAGNLDGDSYHGYWAKNITGLNSHFGTSDDLSQLSSALHSRGMYLMVDIVANHMAYPGCRACVDYSTLAIFSKSSFYHQPCEIDYSNQTSVQQCWEGSNNVALPDLRTEDQAVRDVFNPWISQLITKYGIDGLRIDSAKHQETSFWSGFGGNATVFMLGEVYEGNPDVFLPYLDVLPGLLNYPVWYWLQRAFESTSATMNELASGLSSMKSKTSKTTYLGSFLENHDQPRMPSWTSQSSDYSLAKNAIAFTMLMDGIPIIYQGQEQHFSGGSVPNNREAVWTSGYNTNAELYQWILLLNQVRSAAIAWSSNYVTTQATSWLLDSHTIALVKGASGSQVVSVYNNYGSAGGGQAVTLASSNTGFGADKRIADVVACAAFTTDSSGNLNLAQSTLPKILVLLDNLRGTGLCPSLIGTTTTTTTTTSASTTSIVASTSTRTSTTTTCVTPTAVAVLFRERVTTQFGQTIKIAGNVTALGSWNTASAVALNASEYTSSNPVWIGSVNFAAGTGLQYKYINVASNGAVTWEADPNHTYSIPACGVTAVTLSDTWQA